MAFGGLKKGKGKLTASTVRPPVHILTLSDRNDLITWLKAETK